MTMKASARRLHDIRFSQPDESRVKKFFFNPALL